jgi:hypothetical protein
LVEKKKIKSSKSTGQFASGVARLHLLMSGGNAVMQALCESE